MKTKHLSALRLFAIVLTVLVLAGMNRVSPVNASLTFLPKDSRPVLATTAGTPVHLPAVFKGWTHGEDELLLISEVCYDPTGAEPDGEWIEIYNAGSSPKDLTGFKIGDAAERGDNEGMLQFPDGTVIQSRQTLVIANRASVFEDRYKFKPDLSMNTSDPSIKTLSKYTLWASGNVNLANYPANEEVLLLDDQDQIVDAVSWGSSSRILNPGVLPAPEGGSIERYPPYQDTDSAVDWRVRSVPNPGIVDHSLPTPTATPQPASSGSPSPTGTQDESSTPQPSQNPLISPTASAIPTATKTVQVGSPAPPPPAPRLVINEVHADPHYLEGDANGDGVIHRFEDQFIEVVNAGAEPADIGNWKLTVGDELVHIFTDPSVLQAGCGVVVFGGGSPKGIFGGSLVQTAGRGFLNLNSSGDIIRVKNSSGEVIVTLEYGQEARDRQSITRDPDLTAQEPLVKHLEAAGAGGRRFSPGQQINGSPFANCQSEQPAAALFSPSSPFFPAGMIVFFLCVAFLIPGAKKAG